MAHIPQRPKTAARFVHSMVRSAAVVIGHARRGRIEQIRRVLLEGGETMGRVAVEDQRAQRGHEEHFMGVPGHAVGPVESRHQPAMPLAQACRAAVGRIDVQPDLVPAADVGHLLQRVESPDRRRTRASADGDDRLASPPQVG